MPSAELNKRYAIKVEQLTIPAMSDGLILNTELFDLERRCLSTIHHTRDGVIQPFTELPVESEFIPSHVKTVSQLVFQINGFFRRQLVKLVTTDEVFEDDEKTFFPIPPDFGTQQEAGEPPPDWYAVQETDVGKRIRGAVEAIYRSDGKIGFKFTSAGQRLFVLRLTDEGKRIFGWKHRYIALDANKQFTPYLDDDGVVISTLPTPNLTESIVCVTANSIFNHGHYRHEIAVLTSLPLQQYAECDQNSAQLKRQLASYRFPNESIRTEYRGTLYKVLKESRKNVYMFEHANKTHNVFLLTGTDLQNFHVRLMARNYTWSEEKKLFIIDEKNYPIPNDSLWTVTLNITPLE